MKTLIVYDSVHGNTGKIAASIGRGIGGEAQVLPAAEMSAARLQGVGLFVVGSPTMGGRPTKAIVDLLARMPPATLASIPVAAFDTRLTMKFVKLFGFAADKIAAGLEKMGGRVIATPVGFIVSGREGPLAEGELERARAWGKTIGDSSRK
jgi:flavodoxin I